MNNQTILLTGATSGIGKALLLELANYNRVIAIARSQQKLKALQTELDDRLTNVKVLSCDLLDSRQVAFLIEKIRLNWPELSVVINNAAVQFPVEFGSGVSFEKLEAEITTNFLTPIHLIEGLLPTLRKQAAAKIINIGSALSFAPKSSAPLYCASKAALHSLTQTLRYQLRQTNVSVLEVSPPVTASSLHRGNTLQAAAPVEAVALQILNEINSGKTQVYIGKAKLAYWLSRLVPGLIEQKMLKN